MGFSSRILNRSSRYRWLAAASILLTVLLVASLAYRYLHKAPSPIPTSVTESATYPLYYPSSPPKGYRIDEGSFRASNQVVIYAVSKENGPSMAVSIQPKPNNFDFNDFHIKKLTGSKEILTQSGKAVIGVYNDRTVGSLVTDKSWVLVTAPSSISAKDVETVMKGLRAAD